MADDPVIPLRRKRSDGASDTDPSPSKRVASAISDMQLVTPPSKIRQSEVTTPTRESRGSSRRINSMEQSTEDVKSVSQGDNTIDTGLELLGKNVTKLVDLITTLRDNGIARLDIDLPQIVVVGDQSTGKSSLIEGLSAISVPRKEGTCTRCPLEINLKDVPGPWKCRISLIIQYGYKFNKTEADPKLGLGPWNKKLKQAIVEHFIDVTDKKDIPIYLTRAQLAILNPKKSPKSFATPASQELESEATLEAFSPNVIRLDIQAPRLPSLSFFDLPGTIVQDAEAYIPKMIRTLVQTYISTSRSLVLLTLPADNDRANSQAAGIVYETKAQDRTIGIMTKPDRLVDSNVQQWKEILGGKMFKLKLGYRVVQNPGDPTIEHAEARFLEKRFFRDDRNFSGPLSAYKDRFGTENLQEYLSTQLLAMIQESLPEIEAKVNERIFNINAELSTLPKPPSGNVLYEIQERFNSFQRQLTSAINNTADSVRINEQLDYHGAQKWFQLWHHKAQTYYEKLAKSAPQLNLTELGSATGSEKKTIVIPDDDDNTASSKSTKRKNETSSTASVIPTPTSTTIFNKRQVHDIGKFVAEKTTKFTVMGLRDRLHAVNGGVSGIGDPRVFEGLFLASIKHWHSLMLEFLEETVAACKKLVYELLEFVFRDLKDTRLFKLIHKSASKFILDRKVAQGGISQLLYGIESRKPLSLDSEGQEASKKSIQAQLMAQLTHAFVQRELTNSEGLEIKVTISEQKRIEEQARIDAQQYTLELHELAGTIAYYRLAARRFADYTALTIRNETFYLLQLNLTLHIPFDVGFGPDKDPSLADEYLKSLMEPSPRDYQRRKELEYELELLEQTKMDLFNVLQPDQDYMDGFDDNYDSI